MAFKAFETAQEDMDTYFRVVRKGKGTMNYVIMPPRKTVDIFRMVALVDVFKNNPNGEFSIFWFSQMCGKDNHKDMIKNIVHYYGLSFIMKSPISFSVVFDK
jgi:hypothetical protein